jgi:hypothetical protein
MLQVTLGILTAIGGFVDIGDLVANALVGARFGMSLAWVVVVGVIGICLFAEMSGRVAAVSGRATFDLVRERLGPRVGLANLAASLLVTLLTFSAEVGGIALALELASDQILVNAIAPGPIVAPEGASDEEFSAVERATPLGHWGGEGEIAKVVLALIDSDFVTGETIRVDGGRHLK